MRQKILCIILTCLVFNIGLFFSAVVHSEALTKVDEETGRYLDNLGASQHAQAPVNYHFEQHGGQYSKDSMNDRNNPVSQHSKDSMNHRNNPVGQHGSQYSQDSMNQRNSPRWDAVVVNLHDTSGRPVYLRESEKNRGTLSDPSRYNQANNPQDEPDGRPVLLVPIKEW